MPAIQTRADSVREYLTGALVDGGPQGNPDNSLGGYRSSTEAVSLGIQIANAIPNLFIQYAGGANPIGDGTLTVVDANNLTWAPPGLDAGAPAFLNGAPDNAIVEGPLPGQFLRVQGTTPLAGGPSTITLKYIVNGIFGFDDVSVSEAATEWDNYRATIVRNESANRVSSFQRWIAQLGTAQVSNLSQLGGSGPGTLSTTGSFSDWPATGWCQVRSSGGSLREMVYYSSRTNTVLTVPGSGRALFTTVSSSGNPTDILCSVPGVIIGLDPAGVQTSGSAIQTIPNQTTVPVVSWNYGLTGPTGLQIGTLDPNQQQGIWIWRQTPAGAISTPFALNKFQDSFNSF